MHRFALHTLKGMAILFLVVTTMSFTAHKFYVSITKIEYVPQSKSLQIITKVFIDDMEDMLQARYGESVALGPERETKADADLLEKYILQKLTVNVDNKQVALSYLGHEYENDIVKSYIEAIPISEMKKIEVSNEILFDLFDEQQNIIHVKKLKKRRSMVLERDNPKGLLNFD